MGAPAHPARGSRAVDRVVAAASFRCRGSRAAGPYGRYCSMTQVVILGAGMAGFGAAHRLHAEGVGSVMYEQKPYHGGHTASFHRDGFIFDDGPHISFTKDARVQQLFADSVHQQFETIHAYVNNY